MNGPPWASSGAGLKPVRSGLKSKAYLTDAPSYADPQRAKCGWDRCAEIHLGFQQSKRGNLLGWCHACVRRQDVLDGLGTWQNEWICGDEFFGQ